MTRSLQTFTALWRGITVTITYERDWLGVVRSPQVCHLAVEATTPARAELPITETGYRSHFANPVEIDDAGGPVAFVIAGLDAAAQSPDWKAREEKARQYGLF